MILALVLAATCLGVEASYPTDLPRCHAGDGQCLKQTITQTLTLVKNGRREINLPPIEPLHVSKLEINQGNDSPVAITLSFRDLNVYGLSTATVTKVNGFEADPRTSKYELEAKVPKLTLRGKYKINGKVLILPITGKGNSELVLDNVLFRIKFIPKTTEREGKRFIHTDKFKLNFDTTRLHLYFENLFGGDKLLGDNMNRFLNDNWEDILRELKPAVVDAFTTIVTSVINGIFSKVSYDDIFEP